MGSVIPAAPERHVEVSVTGGDAIDVVEVLRNNQIVHRWYPAQARQDSGLFKVFVEVGWGEEVASTEWSVDLGVEAGRLVDAEPRLRGHGIEPPPDDMRERFAFSAVERPDSNRVQWSTVTWRNPTVSTPAMQGMCLTLEGDAQTQITGRINGREVCLASGDLRDSARSIILGGFVSPAVCFHRAISESEYQGQFAFQDTATGTGRDWYYVRVRQQNGHYAWSSPIWVG
jgi:hypothetical protein